MTKIGLLTYGLLMQVMQFVNSSLSVMKHKLNHAMPSWKVYGGGLLEITDKI